MKRLALTALASVLGVGLLVASPDTATAQKKAEPSSAYRMHPDTSAARLHEPPGGTYKKVSTLVPLPAFVPGLPLKDMNAQKAFSGLKVAQERVDHVDIVFNAGHPGVAEPHYHVIVWYVSPQRAAQLAK